MRFGDQYGAKFGLDQMVRKFGKGRRIDALVDPFASQRG